MGDPFRGNTKPPGPEVQEAKASVGERSPLLMRRVKAKYRVGVSKVGGKSALMGSVWQKGGNPELRLECFMSQSSREDLVLNEEQEAEARRIYDRLGSLFDEERMRMARLLASKADRELFGRTEYEVRDRVHRLGAEALQTAADERQKKGRVRGC
jgi:hypothetical protein